MHRNHGDDTKKDNGPKGPHVCLAAVGSRDPEKILGKKYFYAQIARYTSRGNNRYSTTRRSFTVDQSK